MRCLFVVVSSVLLVFLLMNDAIADRPVCLDSSSKKIKYVSELLDLKEYREAAEVLAGMVGSSNGEEAAEGLFYKILWGFSKNYKKDFAKLSAFYPDSDFTPCAKVLLNSISIADAAAKRSKVILYQGSPSSSGTKDYPKSVCSTTFYDERGMQHTAKIVRDGKMRMEWYIDDEVVSETDVDIGDGIDYIIANMRELKGDKKFCKYFAYHVLYGRRVRVASEQLEMLYDLRWCSKDSNMRKPGHIISWMPKSTSFYDICTIKRTNPVETKTPTWLHEYYVSKGTDRF